MRLVLVRHAESVGNASGNYSTEAADSLSPRGHEQAARLATPLSDYDFDAVVVSPLQRAMQTVTPYLETCGRRAEIWPETAEACWHEEREAPSETWRAVPADLPETATQLFAYRDGEAITPAHPQSFGEGLRRVHETHARLCEMAESTERHVLMVSHGHFLRELIKRMLGIERPVDIEHENCGRTLMCFRDGNWSMQFCNRALNTI